MDTTITNTERRTVDVDIQIAASRAIRAWLNTYSDKPATVGMEYLPDDYGMTLTVTETPYKLKSYIGGGYLAAYECDLIYRTIPVNDDERMTADETLNEMANWAVQNAQSLTIDGATIKKISRQAPALLSARYSNGAEDHTVHLQIIFEVK